MAIIKTIKNNIFFKKQISKVLLSTKIVSLTDLKYPKEYKKTILYPTNDLLLFEKQFLSLIKLLDRNAPLFLMQAGENDDFRDSRNQIYIISSPFSFNDYMRIEGLYSMTMHFSSPCKWILLIDESLEGGIGVLIGEKEIIEQFENTYGRTSEDRKKLELFFEKDAKRNKSILEYKKLLFGE